MTSYIGLIRKDTDSDFGVDFPDFPGCISAGTTLDEARRMAQEALELHVGGMIEDGEALPVGSSLETIMADPENADAVAFVVTVPDAADRTVRVNITLPERLLRRIDERGRTAPPFWPAPRRRRFRRADAGTGQADPLAHSRW
jgi:predicted RNase H-like HicB family nuclease